MLLACYDDDIVCRENCLYIGYQELMRWVPGLQEWALNPDNSGKLDNITKQVMFFKFFYLYWIVDCDALANGRSRCCLQ